MQLYVLISDQLLKVWFLLPVISENKLSCLLPYFSYKSTGKMFVKISRKVTLGDHILNSHDLID